MEPEGVAVTPSSLTGAAAELQDLAHDVQAGQLDLFLLDWARSPRSHSDVEQAMRTFGEFAHDQYQDLVALMVALSTRVDAAAGDYQNADQSTAEEMTRLLTEATYQPASERPS